MITIPLQKTRFNAICSLELGITYTLHTVYFVGNAKVLNEKTITGELIRTGKKGFNFLSPKTHRCIFKRAVYQSKTSSPIKRNQILFELKLPNWIQKITTGQCQCEKIASSKEPIVVPTKKVNQIIGALYRIEL